MTSFLEQERLNPFQTSTLITLSILPIAFVVLLGLAYVLRCVLSRCTRSGSESVLSDFIDQEEAWQLLCGNDDHMEGSIDTKLPPSTIALSAIGLVEALSWAARSLYQLSSAQGLQPFIRHLESFLPIIPWLYATARVIRHRKPTPLWDVFVLYLLLMASPLALLAQVAYHYYVAHTLPFATQVWIPAADLLLICLSIAITLALPMSVPISKEKPTEVCTPVLLWRSHPDTTFSGPGNWPGRLHSILQMALLPLGITSYDYRVTQRLCAARL